MDIHDNTVGSRGSLKKPQEAILVGKILGDGCLEKNGNHVRLRVEQTEAQRDYVFWLYEKFKPLVGRTPISILHAGRDHTLTKRWRFSTLSLVQFDPYYQLFYHNKRKVVPITITSLLQHPLTLAVWYMDDGYLRTDKSGAYLCTSSFTQAEHRVLRQSLWTNFQIETKVHFAGGYARLHIPSRHLHHWMNLISPYMVDCMRYKLSLTP
jgi:hypothetical protein